MQQDSSLTNCLQVGTFTNEDNSYIDIFTPKGQWILKYGRGNITGWPNRFMEETKFNEFVSCLRSIIKAENQLSGITLSIMINFSHTNWIKVEKKKTKREYNLDVRIDGRFLDRESLQVRVRYVCALIMRTLVYQTNVLGYLHPNGLTTYLAANPIAPDLQAWLDQVSANWNYALSAAGRAEERLRDEIRQRAISLYKKEGDILWFAQSYALDDQKAYLLHGKVGEKSEPSAVEVADGQTIEQLLFALVKPFHDQKYKRIKEKSLRLEMDVVGDPVVALEKQHAISDELDEWSGYNGLGSVESTEFGSGTMDIFINVCDVQLGERLVKDFIAQQGWDGIRVFRE